MLSLFSLLLAHYVHGLGILKFNQLTFQMMIYYTKEYQVLLLMFLSFIHKFHY